MHQTLKLAATVSFLLGPLAGAIVAKDYYASPGAARGGIGNARSPWDLQTALDQPPQVRPGDTIWLKEGTYRGGFTSKLRGTAQKPITVRAARGKRVRIDTNDSLPDKDRNFTVEGAYSVFQGIEILCSDGSSRKSVEPGSWPKEIRRGDIAIRGEYNKFVNMVIHDLSSGPGFWAQGAGGELYGCIIYNNGWLGPDRQHGHGVYTQNERGTKRLADNIIFHQFGVGIHAYGSEKAFLRGFHLEGNVSFNNGGALGQGFNCSPDIMIGGGVAAEDVVLARNFTYQVGRNGTVDLGYPWGPENKNVSLTDNYFVGNLRFLKGWRDITATGNTIIGGPENTVQLPLTIESPAAPYRWDKNKYVSTGATPFTRDGQVLTWSQWREQTGMDGQSEFHQGTPSGAAIFVRPNEYEKGRAHVIVYNWDAQESVDVDLSSVLSKGSRFEIHAVQDLAGEPAVKGSFDGQPVRLPMRPLPAPDPIGYPLDKPVATGPEFGVFVVTSAKR